MKFFNIFSMRNLVRLLGLFAVTRGGASSECHDMDGSKVKITSAVDDSACFWAAEDIPTATAQAFRCDVSTDFPLDTGLCVGASFYFFEQTTAKICTTNEICSEDKKYFSTVGRATKHAPFSFFSPAYSTRGTMQRPFVYLHVNGCDYHDKHCGDLGLNQSVIASCTATQS